MFVVHCGWASGFGGMSCRDEGCIGTVPPGVDEILCKDGGDRVLACCCRVDGSAAGCSGESSAVEKCSGDDVGVDCVGSGTGDVGLA